MKRFEGIIAQDYDLVPQTVPQYFRLQDSLADQIAARDSISTIVDIGVGTGFTTRAILAKVPGCVVRGIDNEPTMLGQARTTLTVELARGVAELHLVDALDFLKGLNDNSVDVVASSYTMHNCLRGYREVLDIEILRVLRSGGMFINNDKYAANDRMEYIRDLTDQIIRYDVLREVGRDDLKRIWIEHEIEDQLPERIMWARETLDHLTATGFSGAVLVERTGQYAIMTAFKP